MAKVFKSYSNTSAKRNVWMILVVFVCSNFASVFTDRLGVKAAFGYHWPAKLFFLRWYCYKSSLSIHLLASAF